MNEELMIGMQAKLGQLDVLLHEALQEKMELKQKHAEVQQNITKTMDRLAGAVKETRAFLMENVEDKAAAEKICRLFDENFGPYVNKGAANVVKDPMA